MTSIIRVLFSLSLLLVLACAKEPKGADLQVKKAKFGPRLEDQIVKPTEKLLTGEERVESQRISTYEFLKTLENSLRIYPDSPKANQLYLDFYQKSDSVTSVNVGEGTYVKAAIGLYSADIFKQLTESNLSQIPILREFFNDWAAQEKREHLVLYDLYEKLKQDPSKLWQEIRNLENLLPKEDINKEPAQYVEEMKKELKSLPTRLRENGVADIVVRQIERELEKKIELFEKVKGLVSIDWQNVSITEVVRNVESLLSLLKNEGLIAKTEYEGLIEQMDLPKKLIDYKGQEEYDKKTFLSLLYMVFDLKVEIFEEKYQISEEDWAKEDVQEKFLNEAPEELRSFFQQALIIKGKVDSWIRFPNIRKQVIQTVIKKKKLEERIQDFETNMVLEIKNLISRQLQEKVVDLPGIVENIVMSQFLEKEKELYYDFYEQLFQQAEIQIKNDLLNGRDTFAGLEKKYMDWPITNSTEKKETKFFISGGREVAQGLATTFLWLENTENHNPDLLDHYNYVAFSMINKILALYGYRDYKGQLFNNLHTSFTEVRTPHMDIYSVVQEEGVFAVPDNIKIKGDFTVIPSSQKPVQTVGGMASLLKAATRQIEYFVDYRETSYDKYFSSYEFAGFGVFPKEPLFDIAIGGAAIILQNLTKGGVLIFDQEGNILRGENVEELQNSSANARSAVVLSRRGNEMIPIVDSKDLADFVTSLSDFVDVAEKLNKVQFGLISVLSNGEQKNLQMLNSYIPQLKKLMYGIGLYMSHNIMSENALVHKTVNAFTREKVSDKTPLVHQLRWIEANLEIFEKWQSEVFLWLAVDIYYAVNKEFLNNKGIYDRGESFYYYEISETLRILEKIRAVLNQKKYDWWSEESQKQLEEIIIRYKILWQRWQNEIA